MIETKRLLLRPLTGEDLELVYQLVSNEEIGSRMRFGTLNTRQEAQQLMEGYLHSPEQFPFAILERDSGAFIGVFVLKQYDAAGEEYAVTTFTAPFSWGKGYAGEVLSRMITYAREELGAKCMVDHLKLDNLASVRMHQRLGFAHVDTEYFDNCPQGLGTYRLPLENWQEDGSAVEKNPLAL